MARVIALYLPQFHPIPENDIWWGKGFTEWTNVGKAKPLFKGHYQPRVPADLGYYDLRLPETREAQVELAKEAGIEGFCYYHYWFGEGRRILEKPFNEVLESGKPDFPFCLCWANHSWSNKTWNKSHAFTKDTLFLEQKYPGSKDYTDHFYAVLGAFKDKRYITVDEKPVFVVYAPLAVPDMQNFIDIWQKLAVSNGLKGIHFVGMADSTSSIKILDGNIEKRVIPDLNSAAELYQRTLNLGFDAVNSMSKNRAEMIVRGKYGRIISMIVNKYRLYADTYNYKKIIEHFFVAEDKWDNVYPTILPQWDRSPRIGKSAGIYINSTPELFKKNINDALELVKEKPKEKQIIFLKSWNEWAEGNYVEPDLKFGKGYIYALKECLKSVD